MTEEEEPLTLFTPGEMHAYGQRQRCVGFYTGVALTAFAAAVFLTAVVLTWGR